MKQKTINDKTYYFNDSNWRLMSFSSFQGLFNGEKLLGVPQAILDNTSSYGKQLMADLEESFYTDSNMAVGKPYKEFIDYIMSLGVVAIEKHVDNNVFHGYLDVDCKECFLELKTRSNFVLDLDVVIQCELYKSIIGKPYKILYFNRKTNEFRELIPSEEQINKAKTIIQKIKEVKELWKEKTTKRNTKN